MMQKTKNIDQTAEHKRDLSFNILKKTLEKNFYEHSGVF